jgi:GAF domain-containing protein
MGTIATIQPQKNIAGSTNESAFSKQLQQVVNKIQTASDVDEILLEVSKDVCMLLNADRFTFYSLSEDKSYFVSRVKTGFDSFQELKLPVAENSIIGCAALQKKVINIADVYDKSELKKFNPLLVFSNEVDKRTGYRTKQMLAVPILNADNRELIGVVQVINNRRNELFAVAIVESVGEICRALAMALRQRQKPARLLKSKYDYLIFDALISAAELELATRSARKKGCDVEDVLIGSSR